MSSPRSEVTGRRRHSPTPPPPADSLASDLIWGAEAIARELGVGPRRVFHYLQRGSIPARKIGELWVCSRTALRAHFIGAAE